MEDSLGTMILWINTVNFVSKMVLLSTFVLNCHNLELTHAARIDNLSPECCGVLKFSGYVYVSNIKCRYFIVINWNIKDPVSTLDQMSNDSPYREMPLFSNWQLGSNINWVLISIVLLKQALFINTIETCQQFNFSKQCYETFYNRLVLPFVCESLY